MNIYKKLEELEAKATKFENMKGRYVDHAKKLREISKDLQGDLKEVSDKLSKNLESLAQEIDPVPTKKSKDKINYDEIVSDLLMVLRNGHHVTRDLILKNFSLDEKKIGYLMKKLEEKDNVQSTKDGVKKRLFMS